MPLEHVRRKSPMAASACTTVHHLLLLSAHVAILLILFEPYLIAGKAGTLGTYLVGKSWGFARFIGDFSALSLIIVHLLLWVHESTFPAELKSKLFFTLYGWTAMLIFWAIRSQMKIKSATHEEVKV